MNHGALFCASPSAHGFAVAKDEVSGWVVNEFPVRARLHCLRGNHNRILHRLA